jgi:DNA gyrase inhibitor GyrI
MSAESAVDTFQISGKTTMKKEEIRIIKLGPMRVASAYAFGSSPERTALEKMQRFAKAHQLLVEEHLPPTFGFNNPNPSTGSPNYGYEVWLPVEEEIQPSEDIQIVDFSGGLYAVAPCRGLQNIGEDWLALAKWREGTAYAAGKHQWLEHLLSPLDTQIDQFLFDLYLPIAE